MRALLIAVEGIDGTGKGTQVDAVRMLAEEHGHSVGCFSFPQYGNNPFSNAIADYLNGKHGALGTVPPMYTSLLYAGDRFCARDELSHSLETCDIVLCDRYVMSNIAHQAAKLPHSQWKELAEWVLQIEFSVFRLPIPDLTIILDMRPETASALVRLKAVRQYTNQKADLHENDLEYLSRSRDVYLWCRASRWPADTLVVECDREGSLRPIPSITDDIWKRIATLL